MNFYANTLLITFFRLFLPTEKKKINRIIIKPLRIRYGHPSFENRFFNKPISARFALAFMFTPMTFSSTTPPPSISLLWIYQSVRVNTVKSVKRFLVYFPPLSLSPLYPHAAPFPLRFFQQKKIIRPILLSPPSFIIHTF